MDEWQRKQREERERERQKKAESAEILKGYRGNEGEEALKLKALKDEERKKQQETAEILRGYRGSIREEDLKLKALKDEDRKKQQETAEILRGYRGSVTEKDLKMREIREEDRRQHQEASNLLRSYKMKEDPDVKVRPAARKEDHAPAVEKRMEVDLLSQITPGSVSAKAAVFSSSPFSSSPRKSGSMCNRGNGLPLAPFKDLNNDQDSKNDQVGLFEIVEPCYDTLTNRKTPEFGETYDVFRNDDGSESFSKPIVTPSGDGECRSFHDTRDSKEKDIWGEPTVVKPSESGPLPTDGDWSSDGIWKASEKNIIMNPLMPSKEQLSAGMIIKELDDSNFNEEKKVHDQSFDRADYTQESSIVDFGGCSVTTDLFEADMLVHDDLISKKAADGGRDHPDPPAVDFTAHEDKNLERKDPRGVDPDQMILGQAQVRPIDSITDQNLRAAEGVKSSSDMEFGGTMQRTDIMDRCDVFFSFGIVSDRNSPRLKSYMFAVGEVVEEALQKHKGIVNGSIVYNPQFPPLVLDKKIDENFSEQQGRSEVKRLIVTAVVPVMVSTGISADVARNVVTSALGEAIRSNKFLQLIRKEI